MKIMIVGSDEAFAIENFYVKYLAEAGNEVYHFGAQRIFHDFYHRNTLNKLIYKAGLSSIEKKINFDLKEKIKAFAPEIIWVFKGMEIFPATLEFARAANIMLVNYNPDNPFIFTGTGSGNEHITTSIPLYDLHFTYNLQVKKKLEQLNLPAAFLPFGYDLQDSVYEACQTEVEVFKTCFLGNPDKQRTAFIQELADRGLEIDVYGRFWNNYIRHKNVTIHDAVFGEELWRVLRKYRVQLNLMRIHNEDSHNMRTFEIPAIGGIQLAPETPEHQLFFKEQEEIRMYTSVNTCYEKARTLLELTSEDAGKIRLQARNRCLSSGYSYRERSRQALQVMSNHIYA